MKIQILNWVWLGLGVCREETQQNKKETFLKVCERTIPTSLRIDTHSSLKIELYNILYRKLSRTRYNIKI